MRSGEFTFYVGDQEPVRRITARTGDVVPVAGGTPHTIRNEAGDNAIAFVVHAPGAPMENFSRAAASMAADGEPSMGAVLAIAEQHGIELLGPPPATWEHAQTCRRTSRSSAPLEHARPPSRGNARARCPGARTRWAAVIRRCSTLGTRHPT